MAMSMDHVHFSDLMGLTALLIALAVAAFVNVATRPALSEEERELLAGGSLLLAILGIVFVLSE